MAFGAHRRRHIELLFDAVDLEEVLLDGLAVGERRVPHHVQVARRVEAVEGGGEEGRVRHRHRLRRGLLRRRRVARRADAVERLDRHRVVAAGGQARHGGARRVDPRRLDEADERLHVARVQLVRGDRVAVGGGRRPFDRQAVRRREADADGGGRVGLARERLDHDRLARERRADRVDRAKLELVPRRRSEAPRDVVLAAAGARGPRRRIRRHDDLLERVGRREALRRERQPVAEHVAGAVGGHRPVELERVRGDRARREALRRIAELRDVALDDERIAPRPRADQVDGARADRVREVRAPVDVEGGRAYLRDVRLLLRGAVAAVVHRAAGSALDLVVEDGRAALVRRELKRSLDQVLVEDLDLGRTRRLARHGVRRLRLEGGGPRADAVEVGSRHAVVVDRPRDEPRLDVLRHGVDVVELVFNAVDVELEVRNPGAVVVREAPHHVDRGGGVEAVEGRRAEGRRRLHRRVERREEAVGHRPCTAGGRALPVVHSNFHRVVAAVVETLHPDRQPERVIRPARSHVEVTLGARARVFARLQVARENLVRGDGRAVVVRNFPADLEDTLRDTGGGLPVGHDADVRRRVGRPRGRRHRDRHRREGVAHLVHGDQLDRVVRRERREPAHTRDAPIDARPGNPPARRPSSPRRSSAAPCSR